MLKMFLRRLQIKLKKSHSEKGEISIYLSLVFTLIISLLLTVISAARGAALQVVYECAVESALLSVFGEYNKELLDRYDVFFIDLSYLSNSPDPQNLEIRLNEYFEDNFHPENGTSLLFYSDLLGVTDTNVSLTEYELATDRGGEPFKKQVVEYMSNLVGVNDIKDMTDLISVWDSYSLDTEKFPEMQEKAAESFVSSQDDSWEQTVIKDKFRTFIMYDEHALILMGMDFFKLSFETISLPDTLLRRNIETGKGDMGENDFDPTENILFVEYIMSKMGNYLDQRDDTKLKYEAEYIVFGQGGDIMNMECMVQNLFNVRALEDFISLNLATDKVEAVRPIGETLGPLTQIPEPVITETILLVWAMAEAVTDVRELIDGKRVPLIKTSEQINVSLEGLISFLGEEIEPDDEVIETPVSENGIPNITLGYSDYLRVFLHALPSKRKVYRTMDMIEQDLRISGTGNEFFRFDVCADKVKAVFSVETGYDFRFIGEKKYSYF